MSDLEWDPAKRALNLVNHGVDFAGLAEFFSDPELLERLDTRKEYGETRIQALGQHADRVLFVVYTWRSGKRRLISARRANDDECEAYYEKDFGAS